MAFNFSLLEIIEILSLRPIFKLIIVQHGGNTEPDSPKSIIVLYLIWIFLEANSLTICLLPKKAAFPLCYIHTLSFPLCDSPED